MSTGKTHQAASLFLSAAFALGSLKHPELLQCSIGSLVGIILSPDQDVDNGNISNTIIKKQVGWFGEKVWRWFWNPYSASFKHGRFGSHLPVYGTFTRLFYIFYILVVPIYLIYYVTLLFFSLHINLEQELVWWLKFMFYSWITFGLCASDLIHFFLDILTTNSE